MERDGRSYKGFNFSDEEDQKLFEILVRGKFNLNGLQNKLLRVFLPGKNTGMVSRILRRLRSHGLIKKAGRTYKYYLTKLGKAVIVTGLRIKQMMVVSGTGRTETIALSLCHFSKDFKIKGLIAWPREPAHEV